MEQWNNMSPREELNLLPSVHRSDALITELFVFRKLLGLYIFVRGFRIANGAYKTLRNKLQQSLSKFVLYLLGFNQASNVIVAARMGSYFFFLLDLPRVYAVRLEFSQTWHSHLNLCSYFYHEDRSLIIELNHDALVTAALHMLLWKYSNSLSTETAALIASILVCRGFLLPQKCWQLYVTRASAGH